MKLKTTVVQNLMKKVKKVNINKIIGISEYYYLQGGPTGLNIYATDGNNHIKVSCEDSCEILELIVHAETFSRIIDKTTKEYIDLSVADNGLVLRGNGTYKVKIFEGEDYPIPDYTIFDKAEIFEVSTDDLKSIASVNKSAVANSPTSGALNGYLVTSNGTVTTDGRRICFNDRVKSPVDILLSKEIISLVGSISDTDVTIKYIADQVMIQSSDTVIVGAELEGKETFPNTQGIFSQFNNKTIEFSINRSLITKAIDRIGVFINPFDNGELVLLVEGNQLQLETFEGSFESINLSTNLEESVEVVVNSSNLKELLSGLPGELVKFGFVNDTFVTLEQPHLQIILATCEA